MTLDITFERRLKLQREQEWEELRLELIRKKMQKKKSLEQIADELETTPEEIRPIYNEIAREMP